MVTTHNYLLCELSCMVKPSYVSIAVTYKQQISILRTLLLINNSDDASGGQIVMNDR
jgi:hypothetical protein